MSVFSPSHVHIHVHRVLSRKNYPSEKFYFRTKNFSKHIKNIFPTLKIFVLFVLKIFSLLNYKFVVTAFTFKKN